VRAFGQLRQLPAAHRAGRAARWGETEALAVPADTFSRNTRVQLKQEFDPLSELMTPPEPSKRLIGSVAPEGKKRAAGAAPDASSNTLNRLSS
jgi:hypothetical protein